MKREISAGGIIIRKHGSTRQVLVVRDMNDVLTFPKGNVEKGEDVIDAALREIKEEVGLTNLTLRKKLPVIRYMYTHDGLISKTVHYFIFETDGKEPLVPQKEEGIHDVAWMPIDEAVKTIGYPKTNKDLLVKTKRLLSKNSAINESIH